MRKRRRIYGRRNRRNFSRTASKVHKRNLSRKVMRGGIRF